MRLRVPPRLTRHTWALLVTLVLAGCSTLELEPTPPRRGPDYAVLINGGGRPRINFRSHLTHIEGFVRVLEDYGMPKENIVIFSGDGEDPGDDLATLEADERDDFWILPSRAQQVLRPQLELVSSRLEGYELQPAKRELIAKWFADNASRFEPGDTLFFYVTDHGEINKDDLTDNTIVLWKEMLSVSELREIFAELPPHLRVVMLMSQCFSGSFASLAVGADNVCGYFASSADRPAYGCYPENRGVDGVGHAHHFLEGLDRLGTLDEAEEHVLVFDDSPDVPHASSDVYLRRLLDTQAGDRDLEEVADQYLALAWNDRGRWEPEIRLLDRIGQAYGIFSPRSLAELRQQAELLPKVSDQLSTYAERWTEALDSVRQQNLTDFLDANPDWEKRLSAESLKELTPAQRSALADQLLDDLTPFTEKNQQRLARMETLADRADDAAEAAYRMEVRLGVVLRMHNELVSVAGRAYLDEAASDAERARYQEMLDCERLELARIDGDRRWWWPFGERPKRALDLAAPPPFPRLDDDQQLVAQVMPAWMGIRYRPPTPEEQEADTRGPGAVTVITVFPKSAAAKAGLSVGDVILGPPDAPFEEPNQVREWTMQREIGEAAPLVVERDGERMQVTLLPDPFPIDMPKLPGPPKVGTPAPETELQAYRGAASLQPGDNTILFFWATWCAPCKFALPEVMRAAREKNAEVLAITDEGEETLDAFFAKFDAPFPERVAIDHYRQAFQAYGVSGTPTFVLVDGNGVVQYYETGYNAKVGLVLP